MYNDLINWLQNNQLACSYKKYLGIPCPGCGIQTAFIELLKGNLIESIKNYPALIPLFLTFFFSIIYYFKKFKNGGKLIKYLVIIVLFLIFLNYIINLILYFN